MTKLNTGSRLLTAPLQTEATPSGKTHEGGAGFACDPRTELFMRATTVFAGEGSFYEDARTADARAVELTRQLARDDFGWLRGFLPWLRSDAFIRTSAVMLAAETAWSLNGTPNSTAVVADLVDKVLQRGDEVTEIIQYCLRTFGKLPKAVKLGAEKAMLRMWNERSVIRWDKPGRPLRFADAIELVHPRPRLVTLPEDFAVTDEYFGRWADDSSSAEERDSLRELFRDDPRYARELYVLAWLHRQAQHREKLFRYLLDERHHGDGNPAGLPAIDQRRHLGRLPPKDRHAFAAQALADRDSFAGRGIKRAAAGQWEWVTSWLGEGAGNLPGALSERERWELVLPWMGYMAVLRNLRNFELAGIKPPMIREIQDRLADPGEVAESRQLPFRFLAAHMNTRSVHWLASLEQALQASIRNVPHLDGGRTLIMIDMSGSMANPLSQPPRKDRRGGGKPDDTRRPTRLQAAALFAMALAVRNAGRVDVFGFADPPGRASDPWGRGSREKSYDGHVYFEGIEPGASLLRLMEVVTGAIGVCGYGTAIEQNLRQCFDSSVHTRVAIFSDEQTIPGGPGWNAQWASQIGDITACLPESVPVYAWNLSGYSHGAFPTGARRYALAGLTDASFSVMQRIESGYSAKWPWENEGHVVGRR